MHFYITGHTGFKGSWLTQILHSQGHSVSGQSLDPTKTSIYEMANLTDLVQNDFRIDINDADATTKAMKMAAPDVVIHLAAQPLVRESYLKPRETFLTNVMGTMNVLEAISNTDSIKASLVITTDKVYRNINKRNGYIEEDPLGGDDPYSASKAMADLMTQSWVKSFNPVPTAIARAGNVIGGGDTGRDRLIPDLLSAFKNSRPALIRYPYSVRPWQHVLDCLYGYQLLVEKLLTGGGHGAWNFGPPESSFLTVEEVANMTANLWGHGSTWQIDQGPKQDEASLLVLNSSKANIELGWSERLTVEEAVQWTVEWAKGREQSKPARDLCSSQIERFFSIQ